jgi:hypothetical protein
MQGEVVNFRIRCRVRGDNLAAKKIRHKHPAGGLVERREKRKLDGGKKEAANKNRCTM